MRTSDHKDAVTCIVDADMLPTLEYAWDSKLLSDCKVYAISAMDRQHICLLSLAYTGKSLDLSANRFQWQDNT